jgi:hypothetical protein
MDGCGIFYPSDLSKILDSLTQLELLAFCGTAISSKTFRSMRPHFWTLQTLDIADCFEVKSWMVQATLEGCPLLETLKVPFLIMHDVEVGKPWVSLRLKHLQVHFIVSEQWDFNAQHKMTFRALGRLTELQVLDTSSFDPEGPMGLHYQLDLGLASLETLGKLSVLRAINTMQIIEAEELNWIKGHWPLLTKIEGTFHHDWKQHELVVEELRAIGIEVAEQRRPNVDYGLTLRAFDPRLEEESEDEEVAEDDEYEDGSDDGYGYYDTDNEGDLGEQQPAGQGPPQGEGEDGMAETLAPTEP